ncbi:MAG: anthranilate synthase component I [Candidatus Omnitrophica bacterium]|nr:anthranilate synthase component I [Candidatus Omnitrophota bacterium]
MTEKEFLGFVKKGNLVPVYREIYGDLETPVAAYMKLAKNSKYSFLLESVEGGEKLARYSFLARDPELVLRSKGNEAEIIRFKKGKKTTEKRTFKRTPLEIVRELISKYNYVNIPALPRFCGGLVGYLGYDTVRFFEKLPDKTRDDQSFDDIVLMLAKDLVIFDHLHHTIKIVSCVEVDPKDVQVELKRKFRAAQKKIDGLVVGMTASLPRQKLLTQQSLKLTVHSNCTRKNFEGMVESAKEEIRAGEIIQAVLSQRFEVDVNIDAVKLYRTLRTLNPSPYMYLLNLDGLNVVGSSPELLVRCEQGFVETRPIAGTRPRGKTLEEDVAFEKDLLADPKELAEHVMLVDLGRNDLGRVCLEGTVKVTDLMTVERYSHVMHIVSNVQGRLKPEYDAVAAFEAVFPAGTLSGAPKVRAMEIIDGLEKNRRGPYGGAIGYFSFSQDLDTCITIRTILLKGKKAYIQAGAGIVADSDPTREYEETVNKAKAQIRALELAHRR